jgi:membrane protease YdiL (CAAX protease family)
MTVRRIAALFEVLGVYIAGQYLVALVVSAIGLRLENPLDHINARMSNTELLFAVRDVFLLLLTQYAGWFALILPINWWHGRTGPAGYGLTLAGKSWRFLIAAGAAAAALSAWPSLGLQLFDARFHLGSVPLWRQAVTEMSWRRWEFWLFTAVMGWVVVVFLEELFFRGYCQRRLSRDWGDGPAIFGAAGLFVGSRTQYMIANAYSFSVIVSLLVLAVGVGVVYAWTRSLVPVVLARAIINLPMTDRWRVLAFAAALLGVALLSRRGIAVCARVLSGSSRLWCVMLAAICGGYAAYSQGESAAIYLAAGLLGLAAGLEATQSGRENDA